MSELLAPHEKDIADVFAHHFDGMTREPVTLDELLDTRRLLVSEIHKGSIEPKPFQKAVQCHLFGLVTQALHQFHLGDNRDGRGFNLVDDGAGIFITPHVPDNHIRIDQDAIRH